MIKERCWTKLCQRAKRDEDLERRDATWFFALALKSKVCDTVISNRYKATTRDAEEKGNSFHDGHWGMADGFKPKIMSESGYAVCLVPGRRRGDDP